jgi:hypothetical protein
LHLLARCGSTCNCDRSDQRCNGHFHDIHNLSPKRASVDAAGSETKLSALSGL